MERVALRIGVTYPESALSMRGMDELRSPCSHTSIHWYLLSNSSMAGGKTSPFSIMNGMITLSRLLAALISSSTYRDSLMALVQMTTSTGHSQMPFIMPSSYLLPAGMSRGAIQHLKPEFSRFLHRSRAIPLSVDVWLMNTWNWGSEVSVMLSDDNNASGTFNRCA